jgi:hypothetical protein
MKHMSKQSFINELKYALSIGKSNASVESMLEVSIYTLIIQNTYHHFLRFFASVRENIKYFNYIIIHLLEHYLLTLAIYVLIISTQTIFVRNEEVICGCPNADIQFL